MSKNRKKKKPASEDKNGGRFIADKLRIYKIDDSILDTVKYPKLDKDEKRSDKK